ncbi:MAG: Tat pathway signal protein [Asticcacaulis sp.]|nr:Tat pathway signal protein [Asticcacaulis sp.]
MHRRSLLILAFSTLALALPSAAAHAAAPEKKKGGGVNYTQFPMISVFTNGSGNHRGTMSVEVGLYAEDPKVTEMVKLYLPRLQDAYVTRLQGYAANLNAASLVDTDYIATQLQTVTDQVLGRKGARVLLGSILLN